MNLLAENKLQERLGICKTNFNTNVLEIGINLFLTIEDKDLSTILTFCLPEHGVLYDENNYAQPII